ncbi:MAG: VanW family protein [Roseburia sp.]|nr:VanW family protein [Roseburia sp.]MCM1096627.1 VanW family protein [Ruminococcus flavefaciens]
MGKLLGRKRYVFLLWTLCLLMGRTVQAEEPVTIKNGIFAGDISLAGMTAQEADAAVETYVDGLRSVEITLQAAAGAEVKVTAGELGLVWANPEIVAEAAEIGSQGNVVQRYRVMKDLEHENRVFPILLDLDMQAISDILNDRCVMYDVQAVSAALERVDGVFHVVEGQTGYILDVESSIDVIYDLLTGDWDGQPCAIALNVETSEPRGSAEELAQVQDLLGSYTTSFASSNADRSANIENGCSRINGLTLYPGDEFSMHDTVAPFTEENGYRMAGTYVNGKVVDGLGGGICQVSTTLYNAVLLAELDVTKRYNHSMVVSYVDPGADAAIAQSSGKDFRFVNNQEYPVYIEGMINGKKITFNVYGRETRPENREVRYESEILEVINPTADDITADASQPIGYYQVTAGAHIGYRAKLWKIVLVDGKEESRTAVNNSSYKMVPRSVTVGVATSDPAAYEEIMAAIGTGSGEHVKNVIAMLTAAGQ